MIGEMPGSYRGFRALSTSVDFALSARIPSSGPLCVPQFPKTRKGKGASGVFPHLNYTWQKGACFKPWVVLHNLPPVNDEAAARGRANGTLCVGFRRDPPDAGGYRRRQGCASGRAFEDRRCPRARRLLCDDGCLPAIQGGIEGGRRFAQSPFPPEGE